MTKQGLLAIFTNYSHVGGTAYIDMHRLGTNGDPQALDTRLAELRPRIPRLFREVERIRLELHFRRFAEPLLLVK